MTLAERYGGLDVTAATYQAMVDEVAGMMKGRKKKRFPLHYVLIAGLGGILPDLDTEK